MARQSGGKRKVRPRGLPTLEQARAERRRALVYGKVRLRGQVSPRFWLWTAVILAAFCVIYWKIWQGELLSQKGAVMAKQRAVAETLKPQVVPFRDQIEAWVQELAKRKRHLELRYNQHVVAFLRRPRAVAADSIRRVWVREASADSAEFSRVQAHLAERLVQAISASLPVPETGPSVPALHAYSHRASVGRERPVVRQNSWQSFQETWSTGKSLP